MEAPEEDVRPVELPLFRAAVEVLRIRMFEVEADQTDARGAEMVCEEHRPISIRKAAEVPQASEGPGLRRRHRCPGEPRCPLPHKSLSSSMATASSFSRGKPKSFRISS